MTTRPGVAVPVSALLYQALAFAVAVAERSGGAFDPTIGRRMERLGFNRHYETGARMESTNGGDWAPTYRDIRLNAQRRTVTLTRPLTLDLGGVAKGLAIDLAAQELAPFRHYAVDAGGDMFLSGSSPLGKCWTVGIRHPRLDGELIDVIELSDAAICTSGDYERRNAEGVHHLLDPSTGTPVVDTASVTVIAQTAMAADAIATAAFVMGPEAGVTFLEAEGCDGLFVTTSLECRATQGMARHRGREHGTATAVR